MFRCAVVVDPPCLDNPARGSKTAEQVLVQAFVAEPSVEALYKPVLLRLAGRDVVPQHALLLLPAQDRVRRQLGAVVADDHRRTTAELGDAIQFAPNPQAGE